MTIDTSGNVGIGTTGLTNTLTVRGLVDSAITFSVNRQGSGASIFAVKDTETLE